MKISQKIRAGVTLLRHSPGITGKAQTFGKLVRAATRSKISRRFSGKPQTEDLTAELWAEYFLLSLVNRPINVKIEEDAPPRLLVLIPELDPSVIFGGYIAFFQFIAHLQARGCAVSMLVLKVTKTPEEAVAAFKANPLVHGVLSRSEIQNLGIGRTIRLGSGDAILCYNWTSALMAARIAAFLPDPSYYYFVQEDERIFYPNDSYSFLCESLFFRTPRPRLICNSQRLLDHLKREGLADGQTEAAVFEQGIPEAPLPGAGEISTRTTRRFVFYGRPESHAKRNLMTIALMAIDRAARDRAFDGARWEFYMMGSSRMGKSFALGGLTINCLPNQSYEAYRKQLAGFDVGMVLMYAPHPSVPPFEMVRSGVVTVVNTTISRDAQWYRAVSGNFEPAEPTVEGLAEAIARAATRCTDGAARQAAAGTYHPSNWSDSFTAMTGPLTHPLLALARQPLAEDADPAEDAARLRA